MIFSLKGIVQELTPTYVVIEVNGVGYYVGISLQTSQRLSLGKRSFSFHPTNHQRRRTFAFWVLYQRRKRNV